MTEATVAQGLTVEQIERQQALMRDNAGSCHPLDPEVVGKALVLAKLALAEGLEQDPDFYVGATPIGTLPTDPTDPDFEPPANADPGDEADEDSDPEGGLDL